VSGHSGGGRLSYLKEEEGDRARVGRRPLGHKAEMSRCGLEKDNTS
jgi:hypothetical protein